MKNYSLFDIIYEEGPKLKFDGKEELNVFLLCLRPYSDNTCILYTQDLLIMKPKEIGMKGCLVRGSEIKTRHKLGIWFDNSFVIFIFISSMLLKIQQ